MRSSLTSKDNQFESKIPPLSTCPNHHSASEPLVPELFRRQHGHDSSTFRVFDSTDPEPLQRKKLIAHETQFVSHGVARSAGSAGGSVGKICWTGAGLQLLGSDLCPLVASVFATRTDAAPAATVTMAICPYIVGGHCPADFVAKRQCRSGKPESRVSSMRTVCSGTQAIHCLYSLLPTDSIHSTLTVESTKISDSRQRLRLKVERSP